MNEYRIPEECKSLISDKFCKIMLHELTKIFGLEILEDSDLHLSTCGWASAFKKACKTCKVMWLFDYWMGLPWYYSDLFDAEVEEEIIKRCVKKEH